MNDGVKACFIGTDCFWAFEKERTCYAFSKNNVKVFVSGVLGGVAAQEDFDARNRKSRFCLGIGA